MAIARGAGTEIIRSAWFEDIDSTEQVLIQGVQHHIYTVLSVIVYAQTIQAAGTNVCTLYVKGYDSKAGTTAQLHRIFQWTMVLNDTFVWNDKFSFNGYEPTGYTGPMNSIAKQDLIADQGSGTPQKLYIATENAADNFHIHVTYIDQNNA